MIAAIVSASFSGKLENRKGKVRELNWKTKIYFGFLLVTLMICFSSAMVALKYCKYTNLPDGSPLMAPGTEFCFYSLLYAALLVFCIGDMIYYRTWTSNWQCWTGMGLNSVGSLSAFSLQLLLLSEPATITFALPNSISILSASLISTTFLHEKRSKGWLATVLFSLLAIILMVL